MSRNCLVMDYSFRRVEWIDDVNSIKDAALRWKHIYPEAPPTTIVRVFPLSEGIDAAGIKMYFEFDGTGTLESHEV